MGEVWKAEDTRLGRAVAIKILPPSVAADAEAIARMKREARTAAQLNHPNIATIHAIDQDGDRMFIVMELVSGEPLSRIIRRGPMNEADVCRIGRAVAEALAEAHEKGIVHRDIKPDNILVSGTRVKVLDFGIAKRFGVEAAGESGAITQQGMIVGTVFYMSPEQALGKALDARSDLFSLGVVLYEAATGKMPFSGDTVTDTITRIVRDEAEEARRLNPNISAGLNAIIARCMRKDREERFQSADELSRALDRQLALASTAKTAMATAFESAPTAKYTKVEEKKRPGAAAVWIGVVALVAVVIAGGWMVARNRKSAAATTPLVVAKPVTQTVTQPAPAPVPPPIIVEAPKEEPIPAPPPPAPTTAPAPTRTADEHYNEGMRRLLERDPEGAREAFRSALEVDPHYAKAHFRLGQINLLGGNRAVARQHFEKALADAHRLDERERRLVELGMALINGDRREAHAILRELHERNPRDPDLFVFQRELGPPPRRFRP